MSTDAGYEALWQGHPVEVWVNAGWVRSPTGAWTACDGQLVPYTLDEHAVTLSGISTDSVRVNDPLHGTQYWVKKTTFEANWRDFGNQAVIFQMTVRRQRRPDPRRRQSDGRLPTPRRYPSSSVPSAARSPTPR